MTVNPWLILVGLIGYLISLPIIWLCQHPESYLIAVFAIVILIDGLILLVEFGYFLNQAAGPQQVGPEDKAE